MNQASFKNISARQWLAFGALTLLTLLLSGLAWRWWRKRPPAVLTHSATLAGAGATLSNPFGLAADDDGNVFVTDGLAGRVYRLTENGELSVVAENLDMPSAIALAEDGSLIVANTGAHTIVRLTQDGKTELIAGTPNQSGFADGTAAQARFNAPIGVAVRSDGAVLVADTYNDRVRIIDVSGQVQTLAAGFDTPCGLAVHGDGTIYVAETGNHRISRIAADGTVATLTGTGEDDVRDGALEQAAFAEPLALALRRDGALVVADAGAAALRLITFGNAEKNEPAQVTTLAGGYPFGLRDGAAQEARFNRVTGVAFNDDDALLVADEGNGLIRALLPADATHGRQAEPAEALLPALKLRNSLSPRWPYEPPQAPREIAGTFGEIRGISAPNEDAWFHNGLDIPGAYGETVYAMHTERVTRPLAIEGVGEVRERLRLPLFGYIHVRIGRDQNDQPLAGAPMLQIRRDATGQVTSVRIPRGAHIRAGQPVGTLNRLNHVHLIAGPVSSEVNALAALPLPGIRDTIAPVIESIALTAEGDATFDAALKPALGKAAKGQSAVSATVQGRQRIIATAYDQVDGNASYRRLGLFRLGYRILKADGTPVDGFAQPRFTLTFDRLPQGTGAAQKVYATGSQSGYTERTIFAYLVTNELRDGAVTEDWWDTTTLPPGDYIVRVVAEDFFRNQTRKDVAVKVVR
jgi:DNA-binding beta-propeller fold protein YncE